MNTNARLRALYGENFAAAGGVLHVAAISGEDTIRIDDDAPRSPTDRFLLGAARARADAILTTGRILREEPALTHVFGPDEAGDAELRAWRSGTLSRPGTPRSVVLSSGRDLPWQHPLFGARFAPLILTSHEGRTRIAGAAEAAGVEVLAMDEPGPRGAIDALRALGLAAVTIEAGPTTSAELYEAPSLVDELWLSRYASPLAEASRGPRFVPDAQLRQSLRPLGHATRVEEASGTWLFERWGRAAAS